MLIQSEIRYINQCEAKGWVGFVHRTSLNGNASKGY